MRRSLAWDCVFDSRRQHGYISLVTVVHVVRQRLLLRADHSSRGVLRIVIFLNECDLETSTIRTHRHTKAVETLKNNNDILLRNVINLYAINIRCT